MEHAIENPFMNLNLNKNLIDTKDNKRIIAPKKLIENMKNNILQSEGCTARVCVSDYSNAERNYVKDMLEEAGIYSYIEFCDEFHFYYLVARLDKTYDEVIQEKKEERISMIKKILIFAFCTFLWFLFGTLF